MRVLTRLRTPEAGADGAPDVLAEQIRLLYDGTFAVPANFLNALIVTAALWHSLPRRPLVLWLCLTAVVVVVRLLLGQSYRRAADPRRSAALWGPRFAFGAFLSGSLWGVLCAALPFLGEPFDFLFVTLVAAAMTAAAITSLASYLPAFLCYLLPFIVPPGISFLLTPGPHNLLLGVLILLYACVLAGAARNMNRFIVDTLRLRTANASLNQSLGETHAELDSARQEKWRSLAQLSHELRTPLTAILGFSEAIRGQLFGPLGDRRYIDYASHIHTSGQHLLRLAGEILDLSQGEAGTLHLTESEIDVAALTQSCADLVTAIAAARQLHVTHAVDGVLPHLWADETKIRQILLNLLTNAIKFTPPGGAITLAAGVAPDGGVALSVKDTGVGMNVADIPRALAPFVRLANPLVQQTDGMGLGLAVCKRLADLHGAELAITSEPGAGTTCTVRFRPDRSRPAAVALD